MSACRNSIARGLVPGPRMLVAVHALGSRGGHADRSGIRHDLLKENGPAEGIAHGPGRLPRGGAIPGEVRRQRDQVLRLRRRALAGRRGRHAAAHPGGDVALVDEAHRLRKKVAAHCHGDRAAREAILAGVDSIEHGSFLSEGTLSLMKEKGTFLVPTLLAGEWISKRLDKFPPEIADQGESRDGRARRPCSAPRSGWA